MAPISKATEYNWKRLNSDSTGKLTRRANKTQSKRHIQATSYLDFAPARRLVEAVARLDGPVAHVMYALCVSCLEHANILQRESVKAFLAPFSCYDSMRIDVPGDVWDGQHDVLGFVYQSLMAEGERNLTGQYYTSRAIVECMLDGKKLNDGETFLDPCCGSGAFLLAVETSTPWCLYGFDINPVAVMMAGTNLLVKHAETDFRPNVHCLDFLQTDLWGSCGQDDLPLKFDNIYTNPPWGTDKMGAYAGNYPEIRSKERSSMMIVESLRRLENNGDFCFLLPTSLLKIKSHGDVRKHILAHSTIQRIELFAGRFDGVFTDFFSMKLCGRKTEHQEYEVVRGNSTAHVSLSSVDKAAGHIAWELLSALDDAVIRKMEALRHDDLTHSQWALGIVTGDNKSKVKAERQAGMEPVYTGKQVAAFTLQPGCSYIRYAPDTFQQCAREELYRAPEKLIYRFIAKYPIVAYDDKQCLCLNSANILIPQLDGISVKSTAALLNSALYHYYYSVKFADIKVLKGNLQALPFPRLTRKQDEMLGNLVSAIQASGSTEGHQKTIDDTVFAIFGITSAEQSLIIKKMR